MAFCPDRATHLRAAALGAVLAALAAPALADCSLTPMAELKVEMVDFQPLATVKINGVESRMLVDSGSATNLLAADKAEALKLDILPLRDKLILVGVTGSQWAKFTQVRRFNLGGQDFKDVPFVVLNDDFGKGVAGLLGDNVLTAGDQEYDLAHGAIRLFQAKDCGKDSLAYWATDGAYSVIPMRSSNGDASDITIEAYINGVKIRAVVDSGASASIVTLAAARRAGVRADGPGVTHSSDGRKSFATWIAPVDSFRIGEEQILHTRMRVGDLSRVGADMLLGADFLMSHRVLASKSQGKLYFSYVGGPAFNLSAPPIVRGPRGAVCGGASAGQVAGGDAIQGGNAIGSPR